MFINNQNLQQIEETNKLLIDNLIPKEGETNSDFMKRVKELELNIANINSEKGYYFKEQGDSQPAQIRNNSFIFWYTE